ncbi:MAG: hypothetical protein RR356_05690 [Bacteroidales bacterium]
MKKNILYLIIALVLIVVSVVIILIENNVFKSNKAGLSANAFAIEDTSKVSKIFLADMRGANILLKRTLKGWTVQDSILAMDSKIDNFLSILTNISVRQSVPKTAQTNINKTLAVGSVKVEIYEMTPKFSIFGIPFFVKERKTKTYYMGPATMDNLANFAAMEGLTEPYIVHVPGFRGFISPSYSTDFLDWINHDLFETKLTRIQSIEFKDLENPEESFKVVKAGARHFDLYNAHNEKILDYDTTKIIDMLSEFRDKNFETLVTDLSEQQRDSLLNNNLFKIITLKDVNNQIIELKLYRKFDKEQLYMDDVPISDEILESINRDKFYAVLNNKFYNLYLCQYFHFDRQVQPLSYFLNKNKE